MEGSQVTMIVSVVGGVVGFIALTVAWSQMRIASAKTKLDLYSKRFSVYLAALEYYQYTFSESKDDLRAKANKLIHAYRESKFLFDEKDGIYETLGRIQKASGIIRGYEEFRQSPSKGVDTSALLSEKYATALLSMEGDLLALEEQLKKYLSFHNVRGWTIL